MRIGGGYGRGRRITCRFWGRPARRDTSSHPAIFAMAFYSRRSRRKLWLTWLRESHLTLISPHSPPRGSVSEEDDGYGCGNSRSLRFPGVHLPDLLGRSHPSWIVSGGKR